MVTFLKKICVFDEVRFTELGVMIYFILNSLIISYEEAVCGSISMLLYTVSTDESRAEQSIGEERIEKERYVYREY